MLLRVSGNRYKVMKDQPTGVFNMFLQDEDGAHMVMGAAEFKRRHVFVAGHLTYGEAKSLVKDMNKEAKK